MASGNEKILEHLQLICAQEEVLCGQDVLQLLVDTSDGDMRRAITCLQSSAKLQDKGALVTVEDVLEISGVVPDKWLTELMRVCRSKDYSSIEDYVNNLMCEAYAVSQLMDQLLKLIVASEDMSDRQKSLICEKLAVSILNLTFVCSLTDTSVT
uniref:Replication factor C C-terminal domain-containing protein n=1 Tax=Timema shepardi TaxID=629360 RepID=A0A7R9BC59_TIMSH|nr:unnamed protein product [Timema shepardi]